MKESVTFQFHFFNFLIFIIIVSITTYIHRNDKSWIYFSFKILNIKIHKAANTVVSERDKKY